MIGSRKRKYFNDDSKVLTLVIRRFRCKSCGKVHHELPDLLVPYKRYDRKSIETVLENGSRSAVSADESTICGWKSWFNSLFTYIIGCLQSIRVRFRTSLPDEELPHGKSGLQRIWHYVGNSPGWMARVVRPMVNFNLWLHTRSPFLS